MHFSPPPAVVKVALRSTGDMMDSCVKLKDNLFSLLVIHKSFKQC